MNSPNSRSHRIEPNACSRRPLLQVPVCTLSCENDGSSPHSADQLSSMHACVHRILVQRAIEAEDRSRITQTANNLDQCTSDARQHTVCLATVCHSHVQANGRSNGPNEARSDPEARQAALIYSEHARLRRLEACVCPHSSTPVARSASPAPLFRDLPSSLPRSANARLRHVTQVARLVSPVLQESTGINFSLHWLAVRVRF